MGKRRSTGKPFLMLLAAFCILLAMGGAIADTADPDSVDLFYEYLLEAAGGRPGTLMHRGAEARAGLSESGQKVYDYMKAKIEKIASGEEASTEITFTLAEAGIPGARLTSEELYEYLGYPAVIPALLFDCPYELYWYDKTASTSFSIGDYSVLYDGTILVEEDTFLYFILPVAGEYAESHASVSKTKIGEMRVAEAVADARAIVTANSGKSDYSKLAAYKKAICDRVSYNYDAAGSSETAYGNPWQLIWVFDGDPETKVVCEGYAKAFQYLCDLSTFIGDVTCYLVEGAMAGGTGAGSHMWNVVHIDGESYLADITNCDGDVGKRSVGYPDYLFLKGVSYNDGLGYDYNCVIPKHSDPDRPGYYYNATAVRYKYGKTTLALWEGIGVLPPSLTDYAVEEETQDPWLDEWEYAIEDGRCVLKKQTGTARELIIPGTATIGGEDYPVVLTGTGTGYFRHEDSSDYAFAPYGASPFRENVTGIALYEVSLTGDCTCLFSELSSCTSIEFHSVDTSSMTNMQGMFMCCENLMELDLGGFDTSHVTDMSGLFFECVHLETLDISGWNTASCTNMNSMFSDCFNLAAADVSGFDTGRVRDMGDLFQGCSSLETIDVSHFDTGNVETMWGMFNGCTHVRALDVSSFDTASVTGSMERMFYGCRSLNGADVSGFETGNVTSMDDMFAYCELLAGLDVSGFDTANVTSMKQMFYGCESLEKLDVSGFDTANVTSMESMFHGCGSLTGLDARSFDTAKVTSMVEMFSGCSGLTELSVSSFDTSNVTEMDRMFDGCLSLKTLDLSSFDTSKITSMDRLFADCSSLETVDISSFHTENVTSMQYMLSGTNASVFDLSVLDMTRVTDASGMFSAAQQTSIDASALDFSNVEYAQELFSNSKKLEAVVFPKNMSIIGDRTFLECMNLKSMEIPDGMKSIGSLAFGSSGLETIVIPVSVNKIAEKAFSNSKLKDVYFKGNQSQWEAIDIGADNPELLNATIHFEPNGTWDTGASWRLKEGVLTISGQGTVPQDAFPESLIAFEIQSVIIEEGITEIGANAFAGCKHIAYVFFPLGLAKIGEGAFGACTALSTVKYAGTEEEWSKIAIGSDNDPLYAAEIEYEADEAVPEMKIELTAKPVRNVKANDAIAYTITVKNSGHVSISGIVLQESLGALTDEPFDLAPGGTRAVTYGYIVTQADMDTGSFANTATASGSSTGGDSDITVTSEEVIIRAEKAYSELFVTLSAEPDEHVMPGEPIAYLLFVENTGNVTLTDIGLTDSLKALEIEPFSLAPRQARSIEFTYMPESAEICAGTIENTVTVNAASVRGDNPEEVSETVRVATAGHIFDETVYTWEQNYSALTASHVCVNDGYTETETVGATSTILSPTEDTEGSFSCSSEDFTNEAFKAQTKLVTIPALGDMNVLTLPAGTRRIEKEAFAGTAFEAVLVPNACTYIGESAFGGCANLIYIHVPSAAEMDPDAFSGSENVIVDTSPVDDGT